MSPQPSSSHKPRRNSMRYAGFDYTSAGAYFVTICTRHGECLFGDIVNQEMVFNVVGEVANRCWWAISEHYPQVLLDEAVIMPNHGHGIIWIINDLEHLAEARSGMACHAATSFSQATNEPVIREFGKPIAGALSTIIGSYKSAVSKEVNDRKLQPSRMRWQSKFWDHIIRNDDDLERCRSYIRANPARWDKDQLHPAAPPNPFNKEWHAS